MHLNISQQVHEIYRYSALHHWRRMMMGEGSCPDHPASAPWQEHWMNAPQETPLSGGPQTVLARLHPHCHRNTNREMQSFDYLRKILKTEFFTNLLHQSICSPTSQIMQLPEDRKQKFKNPWSVDTIHEVSTITLNDGINCNNNA